jgi:radical SAM enzyme (TIGR01210 family)
MSKAYYRFTDLTGEEFENLIYDVLGGEKFINILKSGQNYPGIDLFAEEQIQSKVGTTKIIKWAIQCKNSSSNVTLKDLSTIPNSDFKGATHLLIISSSDFSANAIAAFELWKNRENLDEVVTWNRWKLENLLDDNPHIAKKYFGEGFKIDKVLNLYMKSGEFVHSILGHKTNLIDVSLLAKIEDNANEIWVVTSSLKEDIEIAVLSRAVEKNLENGKQYIYFIPKISNIHKLRRKYIDLYKRYTGRFQFIELDSDDLVFAHQSLTIYDPKKEYCSGFLALPEKNNNSYIEISSEQHLQNIINTLQSRIKRELPAYLEISKYNLDGIPTRRLMIVLRTVGCSYDKCTMCGFRNASIPGVKTFHLKQQINHALMTVEPKLKEIEYVSILGLGSFFDRREIPNAAKQYILKRISLVDSIKKVQVESRIEYLTAENLKKARDAIGGKEFEVAIGIESSNENVRNEILKKNLSWENFKKKLSLFKKTNTALVAYVLIKPPVLTVEEAIEDAVQSSHDIVSLAKEFGIKVSLAIEPTFVVNGTPLEKEYQAGKYKPINLWSVIEIVRRIHSLCPVFIGASDEGLVDTESVLGLDACKVPYSCPRCRRLLLGTIQEFNLTQNINVFNHLYCGFCKEGWEG